MQALELISFSGNPYLVCNLVCFWALSANAKTRKCRLLCFYILALREARAKFWCGQNFARRKPIFQGAESSLKIIFLW